MCSRRRVEFCRLLSNTNENDIHDKWSLSSGFGIKGESLNDVNDSFLLCLFLKQNINQQVITNKTHKFENINKNSVNDVGDT